MSGSTPDNNDVTPRWVKVSGILVGIAAVVVIILLFTGHGPSRHISSANPSAETNQ